MVGVAMGVAVGVGEKSIAFQKSLRSANEFSFPDLRKLCSKLTIYR